MLDEELETSISDAVKLHGHLGPFLVIGVRMGIRARETLRMNREERHRLRAIVTVPLYPPFSCVLDGIQSTTNCTVGNQKLKTRESKKEIRAEFVIEGSDKALSLSVNPKTVEELMDRISKGATSESLAADVASMQEKHVFTSRKANLLKDRMVFEDLEKAKERLQERKLVLSVVKDGRAVFETYSRGISGFLKAIEKCGQELSGASVADRVAGKAVALLCVYAHVSAVYAVTLSSTAKTVFEKNHVHVEWDSLVENILNANRTETCPFEKLAGKIMDPKDAYRQLKSLSESMKKCDADNEP